MEKLNTSATIKSVEKALRILLSFGQQGRELSLSEMAEIVGIPLPTTYRLANTLLKYGFLEKNTVSGKYCLGSSLYNSASSLQTKRLLAVSDPVMHNLTEITGETSDLFMLSFPYRTLAAQVISPHRIKYSNQIGSSIPIWQGCTGKIFSAFLSPDEIDVALALANRRTGVDKTLLRANLDNIRKVGYAFRVDPTSEKGGSIVVPILNQEKRPYAALALVMPTHRFPEDISSYVALLQKGAKTIEDKLGSMD